MRSSLTQDPALVEIWDPETNFLITPRVDPDRDPSATDDDFTDGSCALCSSLLSMAPDQVVVCRICSAETYCSAACRQEAWPMHRRSCVALGPCIKYTFMFTIACFHVDPPRV